MHSNKLKKVNGKLVYLTPQNKLSYELFESKLQEGQIVDIYIDLANGDHSKAQLSKVHACIRELALTFGYTFLEMKEAIKQQAGLILYNDLNEKSFKSFGDCSKEELTLAIEACMSIARENNINLGS
jgi:hypothetical protein